MKKDILNSEFIKNNVNDFYHKIDVIKSTNSTNDDVKEVSNYNEGYVLISDMQSNGKGKNGRSFFCEEGKGIYLSILLKPNITLYESLLITAISSVSAVESIKEIYKLDSNIKWVNDIYINDKKVSGILCESSYSNKLDYLIMGIGINIYKMDIPYSIASSIEEFTKIDKSRNEFIVSFLNKFYNYYSKLSDKKYMPLYRKYSNVIGEDITVYENNTSYDAKVLDIDDNAFLHILKDNKEYTLSSGEISIRKKSF